MVRSNHRNNHLMEQWRTSKARFTGAVNLGNTAVTSFLMALFVLNQVSVS
jgi:hypothetical protein